MLPILEGLQLYLESLSSIIIDEKVTETLVLYNLVSYSVVNVQILQVYGCEPRKFPLVG